MIVGVSEESRAVREGNLCIYMARENAITKGDSGESAVLSVKRRRQGGGGGG